MSESIITHIISIIRERQSAHDGAPVKTRDIADAAGLSIYQSARILSSSALSGCLRK